MDHQDKLLQKLTLGPPQDLTVEEYFTLSRDRHENSIRNRLVAYYGACLGFTFVVTLLQGFQLKGFNLDPAYLKWLGAATVGEIAGLLTITLTGLRRRSG